MSAAHLSTQRTMKYIYIIDYLYHLTLYNTTYNSPQNRTNYHVILIQRIYDIISRVKRWTAVPMHTIRRQLQQFSV